MISIKQLEALKAAGMIRGFTEMVKVGNPSEKKSKYGNQKTVIDEIIFDSQKEANRYVQLRYLLNAGEISDLRLQVPYELNEGGTHSLKYIADFVYKDKFGNEIVQDVKGFKTREYKKKKKLMLKIHGIEINEV
jgi:hypothetical protein